MNVRHSQQTVGLALLLFGCTTGVVAAESEPLVEFRQIPLVDIATPPQAPEMQAPVAPPPAQANRPQLARPVITSNPPSMRELDGGQRFVFGAAHITVTCAVLQVCDIALQPSERIQNVHIGDSVRWTVEPAISGVGSGEVQHLIVKPFDVGLTTSMVVTTDRRTYRLQLRSTRKETTPHVSFVYPEDDRAKWEALRARYQQERQQNTMPETGEYLGELDFGYDISGSVSWKPVRVYNDGRKTIIQMAKIVSQGEMPVLLLVRKSGSILGREQTEIVNYRVQGDRYIVDAVFDRAVLVAGAGAQQQRVTISRVKRS
nr:P-type conjugative transfer protein TrbG [uncultured Ralstonia sp.]